MIALHGDIHYMAITLRNNVITVTAVVNSTNLSIARFRYDVSVLTFVAVCCAWLQ